MKKLAIIAGTLIGSIMLCAAPFSLHAKGRSRRWRWIQPKPESGGQGRPQASLVWRA
jgi:hypothetical protein